MQNRPYVIVVGVDFEPAGDLAFDEAVKVAAARRHAEVHILNVDNTVRSKAPPPPDGGGIPSEYAKVLDKLEGFARSRLDAVLANKPDQTFDRVVTHFRTGKPAQALVQLAVDLDADLIVVGTHNRKGLERLVLGSVAETVVREGRCPVQVVRPKDHLDLGEVPEIEPPCEACLAARASSNGAEMWCARHALAKYRPRVHKVMRGANKHEPEPWSQATPEI